MLTAFTAGALLEWVNSHWFTVTLLWVISGVLSGITVIRWISRTPQPTTMLRNSKDWRDQIKIDQLPRPMSFDEREAFKELLAEDHDLMQEREETRLDSFDFTDDFEFLNDDPYWPADLPHPGAPDQVVDFGAADFQKQFEEAMDAAENLLPRSSRKKFVVLEHLYGDLRGLRFWTLNSGSPTYLDSGEVAYKIILETNDENQAIRVAGELGPRRTPYQSVLVERTRGQHLYELGGRTLKCDSCSANRAYTMTIYTPSRGIQNAVETLFFCPGDLRRKLAELAAEPITREEQTNFTDL